MQQQQPCSNSLCLDISPPTIASTTHTAEIWLEPEEVSQAVELDLRLLLSSPRPRTIPLPPVTMLAPTISVVNLLAFDPRSPPSIRFNVEHTHAYARLAQTGRILTSDIRTLLATTSPVQNLRLRCDLHGLEWVVDVFEPLRGAGVRLDDILEGVTRLIYRRVHDGEMAFLDAHLRARVVERARRAGRRDVLRLDWLEGRTLFMGLAPTADSQTFSVAFGLPS